jgi:hypothetical protein
LDSLENEKKITKKLPHAWGLTGINKSLLIGINFGAFFNTSLTISALSFKSHDIHDIFFLLANFLDIFQMFLDTI